MKSIVVTSSCIVEGAHAETGSFLTIEKAEAMMVVGSGRARYATPEEIAARAEKPAAVAPAVAETAAEPAREAASAAPGVETAAAPAAASRRRRA